MVSRKRKTSILGVVAALVTSTITQDTTASSPCTAERGALHTGAASNTFVPLCHADGSDTTSSIASSITNVPGVDSASITTTASPSGAMTSYVGVNVYSNIDFNVFKVDITGLLPKEIIAQFESGSINYYSQDDDYFYAKSCQQCAVHQVFRTNGTYAAIACPICPLKIYQLPTLSDLRPSPEIIGPRPKQIFSGKCTYGEPIPLEHGNASVSPTRLELATVTISCATCQAGHELITCPAGSKIAVQSIESVSGPNAAKSAASAYMAAATVPAQGAAHNDKAAELPFSPSNDDLFNGSVTPFSTSAVGKKGSLSSFEGNGRKSGAESMHVMLLVSFLIGVYMF